MPEVIVGTSALIAFFLRSEKHHPAARRYALQHPTVRWIILETVFGWAHPARRASIVY